MSHMANNLPERTVVRVLHGTLAVLLRYRPNLVISWLQHY